MYLRIYLCNTRWLTLTWDVFKLYAKEYDDEIKAGLTLTWDVFK